MTQPSGGPPVDYLRGCSSTSLRYFEMSKLEHVANLRRELTVLLEELMEESALALFARWMLEGRALPTAASRNGNASRCEELRRAHSLLSDFISGLQSPANSDRLSALPENHARAGPARCGGSRGTGGRQLGATPAGRGQAAVGRGSDRSGKRPPRRTPRESAPAG